MATLNRVILSGKVERKDVYQTMNSNLIRFQIRTDESPFGLHRVAVWDDKLIPLAQSIDEDDIIVVEGKLVSYISKGQRVTFRQSDVRASKLVLIKKGRTDETSNQEF